MLEAPSATDDPAPTNHTDVTVVSSDRRFVASRPRILGELVGARAEYANDAAVYGSDMAASFEHNDRVVVLFGDTYGAVDASCDAKLGDNDDMVGTLPVEFTGAMPKLEVLVQPDAPTQFRRVQLFDQGNSILLDEFKAPVTGFSDGVSAYAMFQAQQPLRCDASAEPGQQGCPEMDGVRCVPSLTYCQPGGLTVPATCEPLAPTCLLGGCSRYAGCVDTRSSEFDDSPRGAAAAIMSSVYIGKARGQDLTSYDTVSTWPTNKFSHPSTRSIQHFSGTQDGSDYSHGHGDLLLWGRPSMMGEEGRQARVYFATAKLPLQSADATFRPRYYAGTDETTGEPRWSDDQAAAVALSMDGTVNGDPNETQSIVTYTTVSWLSEPINRWVMMYGGDLPQELLVDPDGSRASKNGAVVMRFAPHPWGPWSPAIPHFPAGSPEVAGDAYGPGGILYHPDCVDQPPALCARSDPYSLDITGQCVMRPLRGQGRLYAPAIVDAYTRANDAGGMDIVWAISTWLPYSTQLMQTSINPL